MTTLTNTNPKTLTTLTLTLTLRPSRRLPDPNRPSRPYEEIFVRNSKPEKFNASEHVMY